MNHKHKVIKSNIGTNNTLLSGKRYDRLVKKIITLTFQIQKNSFK